MTVWSARLLRNYRPITPRTVKVVGVIGPFVGMTGVTVGEDDERTWVRFEQGGSYPPCDQPGIYGLHADQLESA